MEDQVQFFSDIHKDIIVQLVEAELNNIVQDAINVIRPSKVMAERFNYLSDILYELSEEELDVEFPEKEVYGILPIGEAAERHVEDPVWYYIKTFGDCGQAHYQEIIVTCSGDGLIEMTMDKNGNAHLLKGTDVNVNFRGEILKSFINFITP